MDLKKTPKASLEKKRTLFLEIGLVLALLIVWIVFEWSNAPDKVDDIKYAMDSELEEEALITRQDPPKPKIPPKPKPKKVTEIIEVVKDEIDIKEEIEVDTETDLDEEVEEIEEEEEKIDENKVFYFVENKPEFPGGVKGLLKYIQKNLKYPQIAADNGIQGSVRIIFIVEKDGSISNVKVERGVDKSLDQEAIRVINTLPKFKKPAMQNGRAVKFGYRLPVTFRLQD